METSIHNHILAIIIKDKRGKIIFPSDFKDLAGSDAIRQTLSRLVKEGKLMRLGHGIYLFPKEDPVLGNLYPSTDDIAQAVASRDNVKIMPSGASALNKLGISTQVPMNAVYLTNGGPKTIKAGKRTIIFKAVSNKKFGRRGQISSIVIQALEELGKGNINHDIMNQISVALQKEDKNTILNDANKAPEWIKKLLLSLSVNMK